MQRIRERIKKDIKYKMKRSIVQYVKTIGFFIGIIVMVGAMSGCESTLYKPVKPDVTNKGNQGTEEENQEEPIKPLEPKEGRNVILYNTQLMGIYENGLWKSLTPIGGQDDSDTPVMMDDVMNVDSYWVYDDSELVETTPSVGLQILGDNELGGVAKEGDGDILKELGQSIKALSGPYYQYTLPLEVPEDLRETYEGITVPTYSFPFYVGLNMETASEEVLNTILSTKHRTIISQDWNINPAYIVQGLSGTEERVNVETYAKDILAIYNMRNEVLVWKDGYQGDLDGDGKSEILWVASNKRSESGYPLIEGEVGTLNLGVYALVLFEDDDGTVTPVYEKCVPFTGTFESENPDQMEMVDNDFGFDVEVLSLADLNGDHRYEIGLNRQYYESGDYVTYTLDENNRYMRVLKSEFGS